jgi:hypothetical protein
MFTSAPYLRAGLVRHLHVSQLLGHAWIIGFTFHAEEYLWQLLEKLWHVCSTPAGMPDEHISMLGKGLCCGIPGYVVRRKIIAPHRVTMHAAVRNSPMVAIGLGPPHSAKDYDHRQPRVVVSICLAIYWHLSGLAL